jgi:hypothetical protein
MQKLIFSLFFLLLAASALRGQTPEIADKVKTMRAYPGYFNFYWDEKEGKIWLEIDKWDAEVLYVNALSAGVGSNDIGLDRNQLGSTRIVKFVRSGPKVLMQQPNYDYRAVSNNPKERESVADAFATSVLWGFRIEAASEGKALVDFTPFLLRDAHGVAARLRNSKQGNYQVDPLRSALYLENTRNFPKNSEFEAIVTLVGEAQGALIRTVAPSPDAVSVRMHHSLIELPDDNYRPRAYDPRSGYNDLSFADYATPIDQQLVRRFIVRHRLEKKDPNAKISDPVEPIIYYLDPGAPEPIRSALIEGASWWNQAFEAAGYRNAFQVKVLPEGADLMDVRYNVINWVHRSTRGWSYGSSVTDPRTGEIIKGHVLLGSLRVRQDFLIAQGLVEAYANGKTADPRLREMALARLRQLSAHEVGHTIGLAHNFAASFNNRASVMDYPHPYIELDAQGKMDFSKAYATGIGEWDKRMIIFGYQDFPKGTDEAAALEKIIQDNIKMGYLYLSDRDGRPSNAAHPYTHVWDNGSSATAELRRLMKIRETALATFGEKNIPLGAPMSNLENVLVPLYLAHRYQVDAVAKSLGGVNYAYALRGDGQPTNAPVSPPAQREALTALLETLDPAFLALPERIISLIPPPPLGYDRDREMFKINTGLTFDPIAAAESAATNTIGLLFDPVRLARVLEHHARNPLSPSVNEVLDQVFSTILPRAGLSPLQQEIQRTIEKSALQHLLQLAGDRGIQQQVSAIALQKAEALAVDFALKANSSDPAQQAHWKYLVEQIRLFKADPGQYKVPAMPVMPDGAPIGCTEDRH